MGSKKKPVRRPYERVEVTVRNRSERGQWPPTLIVLHDTESHDRGGNSDLESIGAWFDNPGSQASAHVCVDGEGRSARYVDDRDKAWHCGHYNSASLGVEQIGFATFTKAMWRRNDRAQLKKVAKYIAYWSKLYGIPIRRGKVSVGTVVRSGVVTHKDLGFLGGGHHDPGGGYPFRGVLNMARLYKARGWVS